jgi:nucleoside 2-deoxyribosyltransferase
MKHFPHNQHVYLCGPIEGLTREEANEWRDEAKVKLALKNIDVLDPTRRVSYVDSNCPHADARIFKSDLQDIAYSSVLLVNLRKSLPGMKWGTVAEVAHAHTKNKIIIIVLDPDQWVHPFISQYATEIHTDMLSAIAAVKEYFI